MSSIAIHSNLEKIPPAVKQFAKRGLFLFAGWIILYHVCLKPFRIPDHWLSNTTGIATAKLLTSWYAPATFIEKDSFACVFIDGRSVIRIGDPCNALDLMVLYAAFIICLPTTKKRMISFIISGIVAIFVLNILRCNALVWLAINRNELVDFAHKYAFSAIVYCAIFYGWILYTRNYRP